MLDKLTPALVRALAVFVFMLIVSIIVVSISFVYMDDMHLDQQSAKRDVQKWQAKINSSVEHNQIIDEFESNFLKLVHQGVVGAEDRLSWFETIQQTAKKRGMPSVKYSISTQEALKEANIKQQYRGINVFKSVMMLDIEMAHEGDLFALLNDLQKADGLYAIDNCRIEKTSKRSIDVNNNMKANCELGWYTFRNSKAKEGKGS